MAETKVMEVAVESLTKFGFKANGEFVNWSKKFDEASKAQVVPGRKFSVDMYVADSGKMYANKILKQLEAPVKTEVKFTPEGKVVGTLAKEDRGPAKTETMSKAEWSAKDRSQLIGGLSHDAATITSAMLSTLPDSDNPQNVLTLYRELLVGMLKIRDEVK